MQNKKINVNFYSHLPLAKKRKIIFEILRNNSYFNYDKKNFEYVIVLGGDGTMVDAMKIFAFQPVKILLVNCGNFGFLSTIEYKNNFKINLNEFKEKDYPILQISDKKNTYIACNEFNLFAKNNPIDISVQINDVIDYEFNGSGIFVCTSLGSTGLNRSYNGPILIDKNNYLFSEYLPVKIPCKQYLNQSIVLSKNHEIICNLKVNSNNKLFLKIDGINYDVCLLTFKIKLLFSNAKIITIGKMNNLNKFFNN